MPPQKTVFVLLFCLLAIPFTAPAQDQPSNLNPVRNSLVGAMIGLVTGDRVAPPAPALITAGGLRWTNPSVELLPPSKEVVWDMPRECVSSWSWRL